MAYCISIFVVSPCSPYSKRIITEESLAGKETERLCDSTKICRGYIPETDFVQIL